jgi:arsenate reductase
MKRRVLFLCVTNSCRSQMAEGFLEAMSEGRFQVFSAGVKATSVHPMAKRVMTESGIDISGQKSKSVAEFAGQEFDFTITLCGQGSKSECPVFFGKVGNRLHWDFSDPAETEGTEEERLEVFRNVRNQIETKLREFVGEAKKSG